ncbi:helix-turn-helix domain-containing protein [Parabacteroides sp. FAFU027]|uniref:helix-turn-helix domain-containing protein n=1 Tax=Parabacteroides sp. FAFU027 TaxID=2922715 RepID=UPI001FAFBC49|nr:helix-turn-helix transcriptional regulator [Parabacteroides sp. FAFU027]
MDDKFRIDELLHQKDMNMTQLADKIGLSRTNLYNYLSINNYTIAILDKIANQLNVNVGDLFKSPKKIVGLIYFNDGMYLIEDNDDFEYVQNEWNDYLNDEKNQG